MISSFAVYLLLVSFLFAGGGWASEQAFLARRWPRRFLWLTVLAASVLFPLAMALDVSPAPRAPPRPPDPQAFYPVRTPPPVQVQEPAPALVRPAARPAAPDVAPVRRPDARRPARPSFDQLVSILWLSSSLATALWYLLAGARLSRLLRRAPSATVHGVAVRLTPAGPAVFGVFRPAILWPHWLGEAPAATQAAAIAHEQQHLAAGDPLVLAAGLFLVALAPWNPLLWWQLQRMRFALEADCDQRVVLGGTENQAYALALLHIAERRPPWNTRLAMLMSAPSWLERRVGTLLYAPGRMRTWATLAVPLALAALAAAGELPAPSLHDAQLRLLPPEDTRPGADWARAVARSHYPELFDRHFDGTAVVAAIFNRDGSLKVVDKHEFPLGVAPSDFNMDIENRRAGVVDLIDRLYFGNETVPETIGPWLDTVNPGRVFVVYEVLRWEPDPSRSFARANAAFQAAEPAAEGPFPQEPRLQVTLFMNDDGTIGRMSKRTVPEDEVYGPSPGLRLLDGDAAAASFAAMGITKERLGRAVWFGPGGKRGPTEVVAAWPKRPDDPPDVWDLYTSKPELDIQRAHPARLDMDDEERIGKRYFHDLQVHGPEAITEVVDGQRTVKMPWVLLGVDGQVWDAGLWHSNSERPVMANSLAMEIRARYPGVELDPSWLPSAWHPDWYINGVPIVTLRIAASSPIQRKSDVDLQKRKDILVTGGFAGECVIDGAPRSWGNPWPPLGSCGGRLWQGVKGIRQPAFVPFAVPADRGVPVTVSAPPLQVMAFDDRGPNTVSGQNLLQKVSYGKTPRDAPPFEVTVTQTGRDRVKMNVRALPPDGSGDPASPAQTVEAEAPYGQAVSVEVPLDAANQTMRLVLRAERLK